MYIVTIFQQKSSLKRQDKVVWNFFQYFLSFYKALYNSNSRVYFLYMQLDKHQNYSQSILLHFVLLHCTSATFLKNYQMRDALNKQQTIIFVTDKCAKDIIHTCTEVWWNLTYVNWSQATCKNSWLTKSGQQP